MGALIYGLRAGCLIDCTSHKGKMLIESMPKCRY
uniref:Uncharacterized protein n=1 Tax=Anguilla anguilla TaxID=7936 RepID=A0A0E9Q7L1_ANGAN